MMIGNLVIVKNSVKLHAAYKEIVEAVAVSEPIIASEMGGDLSCFYCNSFSEWENHEKDCIWIRSKELVEKE